MVDIASASAPMSGRPPLTTDETFERQWPAETSAWVFDEGNRSSAQLAALIQSEIVPRLMMTARDLAPTPGESPVMPTVDVFTRMTLERGAEELAACVAELVCDGLPLERAFGDLLAPAARRLGDEWCEDVVSFTDVTIGLSRLHQVVRRLARRFPAEETAPDAPCACLVAAHGEQHTFGLLLLDDAFRRAGWSTWLHGSAQAEDAARVVGAEHFDVFGLSATSDASLLQVAEVIAAARAASLNPDLYVMVGGGLFADRPQLVSAVGADSAAASASDALHLAGAAVKRPVLA